MGASGSTATGLYRWNRYPLRDYPWLNAYVAEGYMRIDEVSGVRVYRRRDCAAREDR